MNKNNIKCLLKNPWFITIGGGIIVAFIVNFFSPLNLFLIVFSKIWSWLNFKVTIPIWSVIVELIVLFLIFFILKQIKEHMEKQQKLDWMNYKIDTFFDKLFAWEYGKFIEDKIEITDLRQICKKCKCGLVGSFFIGNTNVTDDEKTAAYMELTYGLNRELKLQCPNCKSVYETVSDFELRKIKELIKHRIDTKKYKASPYFKKIIPTIGESKR